MGAVKGWEIIYLRARQILPPWAVFLPLVQQPRHLTRGIVLSVFLYRFATAHANATAFARSIIQPVAGRDAAIVPPADATDIAAATDSAAVAAVFDAAIVPPADAADIAAATDSAAVAAACDAARVQPTEAADIAAATNSAAVAAVFDAATFVKPTEAANIGARTTDSTAVVAILDAPPIVPPADAADLASVAASDRAAVAAIRDAAIVPPADAADNGAAAASDSAAVAAACDAATIVPPAEAADIPVRDVVADVDRAVRQGEIFHGAISADTAKQAKVICISCIGIDVQPADGVSLAIKGAGVGITVVADWRPLGEVAAIAVERAIVTQHVAVDGNVRRQHGAGSRLTTIDQLSEPIQLPSVADLIGACIVLHS